MTESLISLLCLASLICLSYAIGSVLLRSLGFWTGFAEKIVFSVPIGAGCVSYFLLACGLLREFRPPLFYALLGAGLLASPLLIRDVVRGRRAPTEPVNTPLPIVAVSVAVLSIIGLCTLISALAPPTQWDALSYHLAGPKTYLRAGRIFYIPYDHHTNFPFTLQMLYVLMLGVGSVGGAQLCHWLCGALLTASVYTFVVRHFAPSGRGNSIGLIAAVIVASTPMDLWEATVACQEPGPDERGKPGRGNRADHHGQ